MSASRDAFTLAVARRYAEIDAELAPKVRAAVAARPLMNSDLAVAINVTQNVLKDALAAAMQPAMPQPPAYFGEIAVRMACYVLTALPPDEQERAALAVMKALLPKLADMQADGNVLKGEWA